MKDATKRYALRHAKTRTLAIARSVALAAAFAASASAAAPREVTPSSDGHGFASVYGEHPADQAEFLSTPESIKSAVASGAPSLVWEALEHGEKVECLDCIAAVEPLLYDVNPKTREIAAWWLRRRIFGVFGAGEVYQRTIDALGSDPDAARRASAAYALGEFLASPGISACASAVGSDADPRVRAAAATALGRLNDDGGGTLGKALTDSDTTVRLAALGAIARVNSFSGLSTLATLTNDSRVEVRRRAIEVLDGLHAADAIAAVAAAARNDGDARVRAVACHALGQFQDASAAVLLRDLAANDPDGFVRDEAQIALRRM